MTALAIIFGFWLLVSVIMGLLIGRGIRVLRAAEPQRPHGMRIKRPLPLSQKPECEVEEVRCDEISLSKQPARRAKAFGAPVDEPVIY